VIDAIVKRRMSVHIIPSISLRLPSTISSGPDSPQHTLDRVREGDTDICEFDTSFPDEIQC
jgi:hypothetical protein